MSIFCRWDGGAQATCVRTGHVMGLRTKDGRVPFTALAAVAAVGLVRIHDMHIFYECWYRVCRQRAETTTSLNALVCVPPYYVLFHSRVIGTWPSCDSHFVALSSCGRNNNSSSSK